MNHNLNGENNRKETDTTFLLTMTLMTRVSFEAKIHAYTHIIQ